MSDMRDALLKAGLVNKKTADHAHREDQTKARRLGARGRQQEEKAREESHAQKTETQRQQDREREARRLQGRTTKEEAARLTDIVRNGIVRAGRSGKRRFYFVAADGRIPFLEMSDDLARQLEMGQAAILQLPSSGEALVISREAAAKLGDTCDWICFWNREPNPIGVS